MFRVIFFFFIILFLQVYTSSQTGWTVYNTGYSRPISHIFFADSLYGWASTTDTLFYTTNGGINWYRTWIEPYSDFLNLQFKDRNTGWGSGPEGLFKRTTNGGNNWTDLSLQTNNWLSGLYFINNYTGWVTGVYFGGIFKTVDSGFNWMQQVSNYNNSLLSIAMIDGYTGYIGMHNGNILKTTNSGDNWMIKNTGINVRIYDIQFFNVNTGYIVGDYPGPGKVAKTTNGGENWIIKLNADVALNKFHFINEQTGWIAGTLGRIYYTSDSGENWIIQNIGGSDFIYDIFFVSSLKGFAVLSQGRIITTTTGGLVPISTNSNNIPIQIKLFENYPNPFNSETIIKFTLSRKANVLVTIFDNSGKELEVLIDDNLKEGFYEINWSADMFSSGIYFCNLKVNNITKTIKLILLK